MEKIAKNLGKQTYTIFLILFFGLVLLLLISIFNNNDIAGVESNVIYTIQNIIDDNSFLYRNPNELPYSVTQYSPFYYLLCDVVITQLRIDSSDFVVIRFVSRIISLFFLICSSFVVYQIGVEIFRLTKKTVLVFAFLLIAFTFPWYSISRPDVLLLFFLLLCIYEALNYISYGGLKKCFLIGVYSALMIVSKQNGIVLPIIIGLFFLLNKEWKAIVFMIFGGTITLALFFTVMFFGGYSMNFFFENVVDGINNQISLYKAWFIPYKSFALCFGIFVVPTMLLLWNDLKSFQKKAKFSIYSFLLLSIVVFFVFSLLTSLKIGATINYFNELVVIMLIFWMYELNRFKRTNKSIQKLAITFLLIVGIQQCVNHFFKYSHRILNDIKKDNGYDEVVRETILKELEENLGNKYFFSEDRNLSMAIHDHCVLFQRDIHEAALSEKVFDYSKLEDDFENGKIKFLVLYSNIEPILNIKIGEFYEFDKRIGHIRLYKSKKR